MNMGYCRFENTYFDLRDCVENWYTNLNDSEKKYRVFILELAQEIVEMCYDDDQEEEEEKE